MTKTILIVTRNTVEALDLAEYAAGQGWSLGPVVQDARSAVAWMREKPATDRIVISGLDSTSDTELQEFCSRLAVPIILIDHADTGNLPAHAVRLNRPFTTDDLSRTMSGILRVEDPPAA